jgi:hypothetical protein
MKTHGNMKQKQAEESKFWTLYENEQLDEKGIYRERGIEFFRNLPRPRFLTPEKEAALIHEAQAGDTKARMKLRRGYLRFAAIGASSLIGWGIPPRTLLKHAELGLHYAIDHFPFLPNLRLICYCQEYAYLCTLEAVREHIRREKEWMNRPKAQPTRQYALAEGMLRWNPLPPKVRVALERLPREESEMIRLLYGIDAPKCTLKEVSLQRGWTAQQAARMKREALKELSRYL